MNNMKYSMFDFLNSITTGKFEEMKNSINERRKFQDNINGFIIDTVFADDYGKDYETAIWIKNSDIPMKIVEDYDSLEEAKEGHNKWCEAVKQRKINFEELIDIYK